MNSKKFKILVQKYRDGKLEGKQKELMDRWFDAFDTGNNSAWTTAELEVLGKKIMKQIERKENVKRSARRLPSRRLLPYAAAVLIFTLASSVYLMVTGDRWPVIGHRDLATHTIQQDIAPGTNQASLILADGRTIDLSAEHVGIVVADGEISYADGTFLLGDRETHTDEGLADENEELKREDYILRTPRGGQYQITLPDGSKVWLNAASTLTYPAQFAGDKRVVELEGEAYFEVAAIRTMQSNLRNPPSRSVTTGEQQKIPFIVKTANQEIEVLGTQFNISAYSDEQETKTTLVEGAVAVRHFELDRMEGKNFPDRIKNKHVPQTVILAPGQESVLTVSGFRKRKANVAASIAWKSGIFHFDETRFDDMMKQIARWYDIDVKYEEHIPQERFSGKMSRNVNLQVLLAFLKDSGIPLRVEDRILVVGPPIK